MPDNLNLMEKCRTSLKPNDCEPLTFKSFLAWVEVALKLFQERVPVYLRFGSFLLATIYLPYQWRFSWEEPKKNCILHFYPGWKRMRRIIWRGALCSRSLSSWYTVNPNNFLLSTLTLHCKRIKSQCLIRGEQHSWLPPPSRCPWDISFWVCDMLSMILIYQRFVLLFLLW